VFSQVTSINGPSTVTTRQQNVTLDGFDVRLQEEEGSAEPAHNFESVSWVAVQAASGDVGGVYHEALLHDERVNHVVATTVPLTNSFPETPAILAAMQTTFGDNTATVRQTFVSPGRVDLFIEEERSLDNEVGHVPEDVAVFAISPGIVDGFIMELFTNEKSSGGSSGRSLGDSPPPTQGDPLPRGFVTSDDNGFPVIPFRTTGGEGRQQPMSGTDAAFATLNRLPGTDGNLPWNPVLAGEKTIAERPDGDTDLTVRELTGDKLDTALADVDAWFGNAEFSF
jgi:hypothetical protein